MVGVLCTPVFPATSCGIIASLSRMSTTDAVLITITCVSADLKMLPLLGCNKFSLL